jgi:hypothetical protein
MKGRKDHDDRRDSDNFSHHDGIRPNDVRPDIRAFDRPTEEDADKRRIRLPHGGFPQFGFERLNEDHDGEVPNIRSERKHGGRLRSRPNVSQPLARTPSNDALDIDDLPTGHENLPLSLRQTR